MLTCEITGDNVINFWWKNYDYIGGQYNGVIGFSAADYIGTIRRSFDYNTTFANLTRNDYFVNGSLVFKFELHLTTRADVGSTSVICENFRNKNNFTLRVRGTKKLKINNYICMCNFAFITYNNIVP